MNVADDTVDPTTERNIAKDEGAEGKNEAVVLSSPARLSRGPVKCGFCGKSCPHLNALRRHEVMHTGEKPFRCNTCSKSYSDISTLRKHKYVHSGEMPYKCSDCNMQFRWSVSLALHRRRNSDATAIRCRTCGSMFVSQCALKQHPCHAGNSLIFLQVADS